MGMKGFLLLALFVGCLMPMNPVFSQEKQAEEHLEKGEHLFNTNVDAAIQEFYRGNHLLKLTDASLIKAKIQDYIGLCHYRLNDVDSAGFYFNESVQTAMDVREWAWAIQFQDHYVTYCLVDQGEYQRALKITLDIKQKTDARGTVEERFRANRMLINVYFDLQGFRRDLLDLAIESHALALELGDSMIMQLALFDLALGYGKVNQHELSIETYQKLIDIQLSRGDNFVSASYNNMAAQYVKIGKPDSAIYFFELGGIYAEKQGRTDGIAASYLSIGEVQVMEGKFQEGRDNCLKAFDIFRTAGILRRQNVCAQCLYEAYKGLGDKTSAFDYLELKLELEDSLLSASEEKELQILQNEVEYRLESLSDSLTFAHGQEMKQEQLDQQKKNSLYLIGGLAAAILFGIFIFQRFRITRRQKVIIGEQHLRLQEVHQEIKDSIAYAKRIQNAILPSDKVVSEYLPEHFILYKPKDVVAGDFYWLEHSQSMLFLAAADCTGHGVPGAMVSVICNNGLNRSVREKGLTDPGKILDETRNIVIQEFEKSEQEVKDGMDIALVALESRVKSKSSEEEELEPQNACSLLHYSGANNPLWIIRKDSGEVEEIKADKQPIGQFEGSVPFTSHEVSLTKGDAFYIFSDGFADQFGGDKGKKFKGANLKNLLLSIRHEPMHTQKKILNETFNQWKGNLEQVDDVLIIGVRL